MTNNQETNTTDVEKAFEEWWHDHTHSIPTVYSSINDYQRKIIREDKLKTFTAGYKSRDEEVEELKEQLEKQTNLANNEERMRQFYVNEVVKLKRIVEVYESKAINPIATELYGRPTDMMVAARQAKAEVERIRNGSET